MPAGAASGGLSLTGWIAGGCVAVAAGVGGLYYAGVFTPDPAPGPPPSLTAAPTDATQFNPTADPTEDLAADPTLVPLMPPRFDVVRVDPDGNTVIAGTGAPGSRVTIFLDHDKQASTVVDRSGAFVSLLSIAPGGTARILTLVADLDGQFVPSDDQIILAPTSQTPTSQTPTPETQTSQTDSTSQPVTAMTAAEVPAKTELAQADTGTQEVPKQIANAETDPVASAAESQALVAENTESVQGATETVAAPSVPTEMTDVSTGVIAEAAETPPARLVEALPKAVPESLAAPLTGQAPAVSVQTDTTSAVETQDTVQAAVVETLPTTEVAKPEPVAEPTTESTTEPTVESVAESVVDPIPNTGAADQAMIVAPQPLAEPVTESTAQTASETAPAPSPASSTVSTPNIASVPVTVLRAGKDGVQVLQSGTLVPKVADKIILDTISYSEEGDVQLSGRARGQSVVRIYLDNVAVVDLVTGQDGHWGGKIDGIEPGIYTLRLDELGIAGEVLSRLETPFKREAPEVLRPPQDPQNTQGVAAKDTPLIRAVTVQQGDTLWAISRERYGDGVLFVRVFEANRADIRDPDLIYPGQVFALPE